MATGKRPSAFIDSNIYVYALIADPPQRRKHESACELILAAPVIVSTQVINEVCHTLLRKADFGEDRIPDLISSFYRRSTVIAITRETMLRASTLRQKYSLSFWDSQLLACALEAGAATFYSEDLGDGLMLENAMRVVNPFKAQ